MCYLIKKNALFCRPTKEDTTRADATAWFDAHHVLSGTFKMDIRGINDPEGVLLVRTVNPYRIQELENKFLYSSLGAAKVLCMDIGEETTWKPFTIDPSEVSLRVNNLVDR